MLPFYHAFLLLIEREALHEGLHLRLHLGHSGFALAHHAGNPSGHLRHVGFLQAAGGHGGARLIDETEQVVHDHDVFGCEHIGLGYYSFNPEQGDTYEKFVETYAPVARKISSMGKTFMYHNHDGEFRKLADGRIVMEHLMEDFPADQLGFTVDTYWVQAGGGDPALWLEKLAGRIPCIHLKDFAFGQQMAVVGEGNINFDRVFEKAETGGTRYMLVEQDNCNGEDPIECLRRSYQFLRSRGFE